MQGIVLGKRKAPVFAKLVLSGAEVFVDYFALSKTSIITFVFTIE